MRIIKEMKMQLGEVNIAALPEPARDIKFDLRSRDEIQNLFMGLQYIWYTPELREKVFEILQKIVSEDTRADIGRPGAEPCKTLGFRLSTN